MRYLLKSQLFPIVAWCIEFELNFPCRHIVLPFERQFSLVACRGPRSLRRFALQLLPLLQLLATLVATVRHRAGRLSIGPSSTCCQGFDGLASACFASSRHAAESKFEGTDFGGIAFLACHCT